jgi:hypothetical protein
MQLYPHWLDGEFVRIASNANGPNQNVQQMIRALKLHALLGTQFVLNDVQIFDSAAILELFADPGLRQFLRDDQSFLYLRVDPDPALGTSSFDLAARGLTRTHTLGWISSVFMHDPTPIKQLADEIINDIQKYGRVDPDCHSPVVKNYPQYEKLLNAARYAVNYFGEYHTPQRLTAVSGERTSYYQVLCNLLNMPQEDKDRRSVEATIKFIDKEIEDPGARNARSRVLAEAVLSKAGSRAKQQHIRNQVVQAWNYATEQTLRPDGGSVGMLPGVVSPALYLDTPTDILVPFGSKVKQAQIAVIPDPPLLVCDIDKLSWTDIRTVRMETVDTMQKLSCARLSGNIDIVTEPLRKHLEAAGKILHPPRNIPKVTYVLKIGAIAIAAFGNPAAMAVGALNIAGDIWRDTMPWRDRHALTNTLFRAATGQVR